MRGGFGCSAVTGHSDLTCREQVSAGAGQLSTQRCQPAAIALTPAGQEKASLKIRLGQAVTLLFESLSVFELIWFQLVPKEG